MSGQERQAAAACAGSLPACYLVGVSSAAELEAFLAQRDVPCPGCGYNLRGLAGDRCPECDQELALAVGLAEPKLAAFIAGCVGLSAGLGFCGLMMVWAVVEVVGGGWAPPITDLVPLVTGLGVEGLALGMWIRRRGLLPKIQPGPRWALVAGCWVLSMLFAGWFFTII